MRTLGIDLASRPDRAAAALVEWTTEGGSLVALEQPADDDRLEMLAHQADVVAIDAPLGWPRAFVAAVAAHREYRPWPGDVSSLELRMRRTDRTVGTADHLWPLSVSTDRIGIVAFRAAGLLPRLGKGTSPARDGSDGAVEVYPAAALKRWGLPHRRYKTALEADVETRRLILAALVSRFSIWIGDHDRDILSSADRLDALVAAVLAREFGLGHTDPIPDDARELAREEGWIHLPRTSA